MRIERRRIVLDENGLPRELVLKEKKRPRTSSSRAAAKNSRASAKSSKASASSRRRTSKSRRPPLALPPKPSPKQVEEQLKIPRSEIEATLIDPGDLFDSARFTPKFEGGQMVGLQIHDPQPGSLFEQADIASGDVIIQINGVRIDSAEQSQTVLSTFDESEIVEIIVLRDGKPVTKTISIANP